ncbi:porin [Niabella yanshanensis]|uniref:Porin n=1 Tax=Niabella yanshanensis TaxID=577386 RepID=A0ABZ0WAF1_9BACT|nr:porin [Niabella yanshanensis]WQD39909.1 porin [Niabella yanshanensis]
MKIHKKIIWISGLLFSSYADAQEVVADTSKQEKTTVAFNDKGLQFRKGDDFLMTFRFRTQLRAGYFSRLDNADEPGFEALVRRMRLRFEGYLLSPKLEYRLQLSFANRDMDLESGSPQIVRDAVFYYKPNQNWSFGLGQTKLPGNRERVNSSGELQMPDRSIANGEFTVDRDFGIFIDRDFELKDHIIQLRTAVSTGEGRGQLKTDNGLAYTGRVEYMPFGYFKNKGDYFEGDLDFEETPKVSIGLTYTKNFKTTRTGGQLGTPMVSAYNEDERLAADIRTIMLDGVLKYRGWAFLGEYYDRKVDNFSVADFATRPDDRLIFLTMPAGTAINFQGSKMVSKKDEVVARYTYVKPHQQLIPYQYLLRTKAIGYSHYFNKHKFKIQGYLGLDDREGESEELDDAFENRLNAMIQLEIGI